MPNWTKRARILGAHSARSIRTKSIVVADWVRVKCQFGCDGYGERLTCPPFSLPPESTRKLLADYKRALLIRLDGRGSDDNEEELRRQLHNLVADLEREIFLAGHYRAFGMAAGPCSLCDTCDLSEPCKYPERARPALEACGVDVFSTVHNAGWRIEVVPTLDSPYSLFGMVLIE